MTNAPPIPLLEFAIEKTSDTSDDDHPPAYGTEGWVIAEIVHVDPKPRGGFKYSVEESAVDLEHSTFWIAEGIGVNYWLEHCVDFEFTPGWWVIESVVGTYIKGDGWMTDDDEEWEHGKVRPATAEEIATISVIREEK